MAFLIHDLYPIILDNLELNEQINFRLINKFNISNVKTDTLSEYDSYKNKYGAKLMFRSACVDGYLIIAKWISKHTNHKLRIVENKMNRSIFRKVCLNGHFNIAEWFHSINSNYVSYDNYRVFVEICYEGKIEAVVWLHNLMGDVDLTKIIFENNYKKFGYHGIRETATKKLIFLYIHKYISIFPRIVF